jgi:hypothetical protein
MQKIGLYDKVSVEECWRRIGKAPSATAWVDVNKGGLQSPDIRCRLVARVFKSNGKESRDDFFA